MEERIPNNSDSSGIQFALLRDCAQMDGSVVERLRAAVKTSEEWAEQTLDVLIRLDDDLQAFDKMANQDKPSLSLPERLAFEEPNHRTACLEKPAHPLEQGIQRLRNSVLEIIMSMQNQDILGQAIERTASALEKRTAAIGRIVEESHCDPLHTGEIAEMHRLYRTEDDRHRAAGSDEAKYNDETDYDLFA